MYTYIYIYIYIYICWALLIISLFSAFRMNNIGMIIIVLLNMYHVMFSFPIIRFCKKKEKGTTCFVQRKAGQRLCFW